MTEVRRAVRRMLQRLDLPVGSLVLAAVSGGPDSLALAAGLAAETAAAGVRAGAVTVDHGLQPGSAERAATVAGTCRDLGLSPIAVERVQVDLHAGDGPEAAARNVRYRALDTAADRAGAAAILLGHTLDDQAETVLLGLARGSGTRSLSGMPATRGRYARPLLAVRRSTTLAACRQLQLPVWEDPHNDDPRFTRVRVRRDVLPMLESALGPGVAEALARSAQLLREDADALDEVAADASRGMVGADGPGLPVPGLLRLPAAVRRRVIRAAALQAGVPAGRLTAAQLREVDRLVAGWQGQGPVRLPGGIDVVRTRGGACDTLVFR